MVDGKIPTDELETPHWLWIQLAKVFRFKLDACASDENHLCEKWFSAENSCLENSWKVGGAVFLNPPYSNPAPFLARAYEESLTGMTSVCLVKFDPSTRWWNEHVAHKATVIAIPHRVRFYHRGLPTPYAASFPSAMLIYWGISWTQFMPRVIKGERPGPSSRR